MRVIAGELKGRRLASPIGNDVRPTSDKVKEAIFSMLIPYLYEGCVCADLFAGSGGLGIEAISRGASRVFFSDSSRSSLALVRENVKHCGVEDRAVYLAGDFRSNIKRINETVDIYLLDPPYADGMLLPALKAIDEKGNMRAGGAVVCEHSKRDVLPEEYCGFRAVKQRRYGATSVTIYERTGEDDA